MPLLGGEHLEAGLTSKSFSTSAEPDVSEREPPSLDNRTDLHVESALEARTSDDDGVELTIFAAGVDIRGQIFKKRVIEVTTDEGPIELL